MEMWSSSYSGTETDKTIEGDQRGWPFWATIPVSIGGAYAEGKKDFSTSGGRRRKERRFRGNKILIFKMITREKTAHIGEVEDLDAGYSPAYFSGFL
jgi:hypothetical protein